MKLHAASIPRLEAQPDAHALLTVFYSMIAEAEEEGRTCGQVCMPFIEEGDEFVEGEWVPEFWFVIRKVLPDD